MNNMKIDNVNLGKFIDGLNKNNSGDKSFGNLLKHSLDEVNKLQNEADNSIKAIVSGKMDNIQDAVLAIEKADISLKLLTQIRNKAVEAYKEVMRMQV